MEAAEAVEGVEAAGVVGAAEAKNNIKSKCNTQRRRRRTHLPDLG